jgi:hypothetical protein
MLRCMLEHKNFPKNDVYNIYKGKCTTISINDNYGYYHYMLDRAIYPHNISEVRCGPSEPADQARPPLQQQQ